MHGTRTRTHEFSCTKYVQRPTIQLIGPRIRWAIAVRSTYRSVRSTDQTTPWLGYCGAQHRSVGTQHISDNEFVRLLWFAAQIGRWCAAYVVSLAARARADARPSGSIDRVAATLGQPRGRSSCAVERSPHSTRCATERAHRPRGRHARAAARSSELLGRTGPTLEQIRPRIR
jgi:hypothetical protein